MMMRLAKYIQGQALPIASFIYKIQVVHLSKHITLQEY